MSRNIFSPYLDGGAGNQSASGLSPFLQILYQAFLQKNVWLEFFVFSAVWRPLEANASGKQSAMTIDPSIDLIVLEQNLTTFDAGSHGNPIATPDYLLEVQEKSGNSNWSDGPIHVCNWTGESRNAGNMSYRLPFPRYVRGNNTVIFKLTNNTAVPANVDLALVGVRVTYTRTSREQLFGIAF